MRVFHTLMFDENIEGTTALYTDPSHNGLLGLVEKLSIFAVSDSCGVVSGTITLTVQIEESADQVRWSNKAGTAEINAATLSTSAVTVSVGRDAGTVPSSGYVRLRISLGGTGTSQEGHIRIWVTGRGEQAMG